MQQAISPTRTHILLACLIGILAGMFHLARHTLTGETDLWLAYGSAQYLLKGLNPYEYPTGGWPSNPMPTVLVMLPFAILQIPLGLTGAICLGIASALFSHAALSRSEPSRLLALLSVPALWSLHYAQWSLLLLAIWITPQLAPLTLIKPHQGWIIGLLHATPRRVVIVLSIVTLCFLLAPSWVRDWLGQVGRYDGTLPALLGPGALGLLVLFRRRDKDALLYAGLLVSPMRAMYDPLMVFAVAPAGWRSILFLVLNSYLAVFLTISGILSLPVAVVCCLYLPTGLLLIAPDIQRGLARLLAIWGLRNNAKAPLASAVTKGNNFQE
jgi:hypothetical protein